ncbi:uncharacterized protein LOC114531146 [Dendronephthya gigantea]|uniref:uncharacterized protein LOC114531146 n=1 Tax=Dendronephthya gigantea TaxID=151771 RepID=UPI00106C0B47|nr:uncharacterized protein LOC114531146 [Dendronephthya gigantea]
MPPSYCQKPYPISRGLSQYLFRQEPSNYKPLQFDESTALDVYRKQKVDDDLRKVVRALWKPLELFPEINHCAMQFSVTIQTDRGIEELKWEVAIRKARRDLHCVFDALGILHQGWFRSNILLKQVQHILDSKNGNDADTNEEVKKIRELKDNLQNLNNFLDRVLLHYSGFDNKLSSTLIKDIKRTTKKIHDVIKQLKSNLFESVIPPSMVTEEDVLCSVLGLNDDFAKRLQSLSEGMRQHKSDMYYLKYFLGEFESRDVNLHDIEAVQRGLQQMGFIENRSCVIAKWIAEKSFPEHRSLLAWAQIYIENLFKYDIFLNDQVRKFPFEERCLNKWFSWNVEMNCKSQDGPDEPQVFVINTTEKEEATRVAEAKLKESNPNEQLFFHGTDHKSVENILKCGIRLGNGKQCDFSNGFGFYLADDFKYALEEHAMKSNFAAVIMFNLGDSCRKKCLDLSCPERRKDLKSVRDYFQAGEPRRHGLDQKLYQEMKNSYCIFGPVSRDGRDSKSKNKWENVMQICIRNKELAEEIGSLSHIVGIIFLNSEVPT